MEWDDEGRIINYDDEMCWERERRRRFERADGEHVMGKPESKLMRQLQAKHGLSEEEVRSHKKFRKMLADVQDKKPKFKPMSEALKIPTVYQFMSRLNHYIEDEEIRKELWKRYGGGFVDDKRPKKFHYATVPKALNRIGEVFQALHDQTDGKYYFNPQTNEVGFQYEENLSMFLLVLGNE